MSIHFAVNMSKCNRRLIRTGRYKYSRVIYLSLVPAVNIAAKVENREIIKDSIYCARTQLCHLTRIDVSAVIFI